jgi:hypothetical protein
MTRQRALKRRIRARMAKTGESYSTARREVLKRLGTAVPEQDDAPAVTVPGQRRFYRAARRFLPGAALVVLVGAVVGVVLIDSGDEEGTKQPSVEQQVSPADELPAGLRELFVRERLDLDRVRSVQCGAGRQAPIEFRPFYVRLIQVLARDRGTERARYLYRRHPPRVCETELRSGAITVSAKIGDAWVEIVARAQVARISECPEATDAFQRAGVPVPTEYAKCPSQRRIEEMIPALRRVQRDAERLAASTTAPG